jgi:hypothetical protein
VTKRSESPLFETSGTLAMAPEDDWMTSRTGIGLHESAVLVYRSVL